MESSQVLGGSSGKKCSDTSESGWTMYIGSQIFNDKKNDNNPNNSHREDHNDDDDDDESDDSMASDASSGPIDHLNELMMSPSGTKEGSEVVLGGLKSTTGNLEQGKCFDKRHCKQAKKTRGDERRVRRLSEKRLLDHHDDQQTVPEADSCESQV